MERYEYVKDIGSGNFGVAKLVRDRWTKELFAVKYIERGQKVSQIHLSFSFCKNISVLFFFFFFNINLYMGFAC